MGQLLKEYPFGADQSLDLSSVAGGIYHLVGELNNGQSAYLGDFLKQ
jgi:hypothetical protein